MSGVQDPTTHLADTLVVSGRPLPSDRVEAVARRAVLTALADGVLPRVRQWAEHADRVAARRPVYGRSTGVGANREVAVDDLAAGAGHALRLLRSHATSAGPLRAPERVRAMLVIRLNQLAAGGNGVAPGVVEALAAMLAADALPPVREWVGIGTGDLAALGTTALALIGEIPCATAAPIHVTFGAGDALAFLSSNAATLGDAALAVAGVDRLVGAAIVTAALTWVAVRGNGEAFAPAVERATPFPGTVRVCAVLRALTAGSTTEPARIQDPYGLRAAPQVHGALVDAVERAERVVATMTATPSENPALIPGLEAAHHGAFHAVHLGQALDGLLLAVAQGAALGLGRVTMLAEPAITGDEPFLGDGTPGASGTMVVEYAASAAVGELRALAAPAGLQTVTISRGLEDGASFAALSARQALDAVAPLRSLIAAELLVAARALVGRTDVPAALRPVLAAVTAAVPVGRRADRDLTADLLTCGELVDTLPGLVPGPAAALLRGSSRP